MTVLERRRAMLLFREGFSRACSGKGPHPLADAHEVQGYGEGQLALASAEFGYGEELAATGDGGTVDLAAGLAVISGPREPFVTAPANTYIPAGRCKCGCEPCDPQRHAGWAP